MTAAGDFTLKIACLQYDHTPPLFDESVRIAGSDATFETTDIPSGTFERVIRGREFDVSELGLTYVLRLLDLQDPPFVALPIFLARIFRYSAVFINASRGRRTTPRLERFRLADLSLDPRDPAPRPE